MLAYVDPATRILLTILFVTLGAIGGWAAGS